MLGGTTIVALGQGGIALDASAVVASAARKEALHIGGASGGEKERGEFARAIDATIGAVLGDIQRFHTLSVLARHGFVVFEERGRGANVGRKSARRARRQTGV